MHGIDAYRSIDFDRHINGFESSCQGRPTNGERISTDTTHTGPQDFLRGPTRKTSPFEERGGTPSAPNFVSLASTGSGTQSIDPELFSVLKRLFSLLGGKKGAAAPSDGFEPVRLATKGTDTVEHSHAASPARPGTTKIEPGDDPTHKKVASTSQATDVSERGHVIIVDTPIIVDGGVFDGKGATYTASSKLGDGGQSEDQKPIFILMNGATLKNVTLGENGADGIHVYGGATLENVNWLDVGEDALTVKSAGDVTILGGSAKGATDKIFQINADTHFVLKNFDADGFTSLVRTNGGKQIDAEVIIDGGSFSNGTNLFRTDSSLASVSFQSNITLDNVRNRTRVGDDQSGV
ncbi:pectate lyase [Rhizobium leguminosarum]|uniref:pectate lyase n=1 Tax=Rhizobium leguminosarum TaxID=384 RepID=UPI003F9C3D33